MPVPPSPPLDETIIEGQFDHVHDHEVIADALNNDTASLASDQTISGVTRFEPGALIDNGSQVVDPRAYGTINLLGAVDCTAIVQDALDSNPKAVIQLPPGILLVNGSPLRMTDGQTLRGASRGATEIRCTRATGSHLLGIITNDDHTNGNVDLSVEGIYFNRTFEVGLGSFDEHIYFQFVDNARIENNTFESAVTETFHSGKQVLFWGGRNATVKGNKFINPPDSSLGLSDGGVAAPGGGHIVEGNHFVSTESDFGSTIVVTTNDNTIIGNTFELSNDNTQLKTGNGFTNNWIETGQANESGGIHIKGLTIIGNVMVDADSLIHGIQGSTISGNTLKNANIHYDSTDAGATERNNNAVVVGNTVNDGGRIVLKYVDEPVVVGNTVSGATDTAGITIDNCSRPLVAGNRTWACDGDGISLSNCPGPLTVVNNTSYDNSNKTINAYFGIIINGATINHTGSLISGNVCYDTRGGSARQYAPMYFNRGIAITLTNNVLSNGVTVAGLYETNAPTYALRSNNVVAGVIDRVSLGVVATGSLPAAAASRDGTAIIEDAGAGDRNLIIFAGGQRFRIDGGAAF